MKKHFSSSYVETDEEFMLEWTFDSSTLCRLEGVELTKFQTTGSVWDILT